MDQKIENKLNELLNIKKNIKIEKALFTKKRALEELKECRRLLYDSE